MKLDVIRQAFRPLFGAEHRETAARFLKSILLVGLAVDLSVIALRVLRGASLPNVTLLVLGSLFFVQLGLVLLVRRGYVYRAALILVAAAWAGVTYLAGSADGVRDVAVYIYILIILVAALLTNWQTAAVLTAGSVAAIWFFAITETRGLRIPNTDSPLNIAVDLTAVFVLLFLLVYLVINTVRTSLHAVRVGEAKFRKIFHVSPVAMAILSLEEGRLIDANPAYWRLTGLDPAEALGRTTVELGSWSSDRERQQFIARLKVEKSIQNADYKIRNSSGAERTTYAFYEIVDFERQPAVLAIFHDITEQRQSEQALQASEQKYRNFVEQSIEGIWFLAFDQPIPVDLPAEQQVELIYRHAYIAECNDVLARMYGYDSSAEIRGVRLLDLQAAGRPPAINLQATLKLVRDGYRSGLRETVERTRDGGTIHLLNSAIGILQDECLVGLWGTQLDITVLKNTEAALRRSEARLRALLDAIPDMIFEFKRDGTILDFVSSANNRPLVPPEQFLGKTLQDFMPASVVDQTMFAVARALDSGQVHAFEYQLQQNGESKTFEARITPLSTDTVLAIVRDVTLQKWILGEREKLITELEVKNAELERFTYTASHDLKSPLITIKGFLGFLQEDARRGNLKRLENDIQRISNAADKMQRLLNDLLELSRIGRLVNKSEPVDLNGLIPEVLELVHGRIHAGGIRVRVEADLPVVYGDRPRLLEVWQNLVDNAAKFMGDQPQPQIEIGQVQNGVEGFAALFVRDNGIGIDPRFKDRVFGLFDKLDPRTEGTGIGLALVKRIVEFHGGRIWLESEPGKGATFYFTLPQVPAEA